MNENGQDNSGSQPIDEKLLSELKRLAKVLDSQRYPGSAWPVRRRRRILRIVWPAAASAAAAAILLAIVLSAFFDSDGTTNRQEIVQQPIANGPSDLPGDEEELVWAVPTDIDPAAASDLAFELPEISLPTGNGDETLDWGVPTFSLPSPEEITENHDS